MSSDNIRRETDKIRRETVGKWLKESFEWRIPVYQRHYAWSSDEDFGPIQSFWETAKKQTIARLDKDAAKPHPHYFGAILVEPKPEPLKSVQKYDVVDGQQRLTTINLAMFAIIRVAGQYGHKQKMQNELAEYIFNNPAERKNQKLVPTNFDRIQFDNLLSSTFNDLSELKQKGDNGKSKNSRIVQSCDFFVDEFEKFIEYKKESNAANEMEIINALIDTIVNGFHLILIPLEKDDESQKVFESLNNMGKQLTTFDLIRNDVFYRADKEERGSDEKLFYSKPWQQFEDPFWEESFGQIKKVTHIEAYIARMLRAKKKGYLSMERNSIVQEYKNFAQDQKKVTVSVSREIEAISEYVDVYKHLVDQNNTNPLGSDFDFGYFYYKLCNNMDFYPTLFIIAKCEKSNAEKQRMVNLLESYVIRRHICDLTSKNYNMFATDIFRDSGDLPSYATLYESLNNSPENKARLFPSNQEVKSACLSENFYKNKAKKYIFDRIVDREARVTMDEKCDTDGLTIDHIIPRAWRDNDGWRNALLKISNEVDIGVDIDIKINTIGNLTPMSRGRNAAKSNHGWDGEKGARKLLDRCGLPFTRKLADNESWGLEDVLARSEELSAIICEIWPEKIPSNEQ